MNPESQWQRLAQAIELPPKTAQDIYADLKAQYTQPERHYHNLAHILDVLTLIQQLTPTPSAELLLAAWFHDAVYNSKSKDNETHSASLAQVTLTPFSINVGRIEELILATASHHAPADDLEMQILLDADLAILGTGRKMYQAYTLAIRQEYSWVEEAEYKTGRIAVLQQFLSRPNLYFTPQMQAARQKQAIDNLQWELAQLANDIAKKHRNV